MTGIQETRPAQTTRWHVVTGGPSSGKTTTVNLLRDRGYTTTIEHPRHYIDLQRITGRSTEEIRARQGEFQRAVVEMQIEQERALDPQQTVFLDRALPDSLASTGSSASTPTPPCWARWPAPSTRRCSCWTCSHWRPTTLRTEDPAAQRRIHDLLGQVYRELPFPVVTVPALAPDARVNLILKRTSAFSPRRHRE